MISHFITQLPSWTRKLLVFSLIALGLAAIVVALTPKANVSKGPAPIQKNIDGSISEFDRVVFNGETLTVPEELPTYQLEPLDLRDIGAILASQLNLSADSSETDFWSNQQYTLMFVPDDKSWQLMVNEPSESSAKIEVNNLDSQALTALSQILPELAQQTDSLPLSPQLSQADYLIGQYEQRNVSPELATHVSLPVAQQTPNDYPLIINNSPEPPIMISLDGVGQITKLIFRSQFFRLTDQTPTNTSALSTNQALTNIERNRASVVVAKDEDYNEIDLSLVTTATFRSVKLEYRAYPQGAGWLASPFYRFSGVITTENRQQLEAEVITPAIEF